MDNDAKAVIKLARVWLKAQKDLEEVQRMQRIADSAVTLAEQALTKAANPFEDLVTPERPEMIIKLKGDAIIIVVSQSGITYSTDVIEEE